jgi:uncharacterized membrane protein
MRKLAETLSLAGLAALALIVVNALHGPHHVPEKIPVHFDAAGQPNGWGSSVALLFLPIVAAGLYILLTVIAQFPSLFNYPVKVTADNRTRLEPLAQSLLSCVKAEILLLFVWIEFAWIQAIRGQGSVIGLKPIVVFLAAIAITIIVHFVAMFRTGKPS